MSIPSDMGYSVVVCCLRLGVLRESSGPSGKGYPVSEVLPQTSASRASRMRSSTCVRTLWTAAAMLRLLHALFEQVVAACCVHG